MTKRKSHAASGDAPRVVPADYQAYYAGLSEHQHQRELMEWASLAVQYGHQLATMWANTAPTSSLRLRFPEWIALKGRVSLSKPSDELKWLLAVPNGGKRGGTRSQAQREGGKLKLEGVKAGVSDLFLPIVRGGYSGLWIEMKALKGRESAVQAVFRRDMEANGYRAVVCHGYWSAVGAIWAYLDLPVKK